MHKLKEKLYDILFEIEEHGEKNSSKLSDMEIEKIHKITDTIKNIDKIEMLESGDYSEASEWTGEGRIHGNSYGNGRLRAKRDSMGRYSRNYDNFHGDERYSRTGAKEYMLRQLKDMLTDTQSQKEKAAIEDCIEKIERV